MATGRAVVLSPRGHVAMCEGFFFFNFVVVVVLFIYLFLREKELAQVRKGQRDRETQNLKQTPGSELSAQSLMLG